MDTLNHALLVVHLLAMAMGLSVTFGHLVLKGLLAKGSAQDRVVLNRFVPGISRTGHIGLALLWATGLAMFFTKWSGIGFGSMPWTFHAKLTAVVALTIVVLYVRTQAPRAASGDAAAQSRIERIAPIASLAALLAVILAVVTFG
jgi:uncharacterized membrane protein